MNHILRITYGPVQGFIAAARKTRDLEAGSDILVEVGREICRTVQKLDSSAKPIFPAVFPAAGANVDCANVLQFLVGGNPKVIADECKQSVLDVLRRYWSLIPHKHIRSYDEGLCQIERFPEFFAAWAPMEDDGSDYSAAQKQVDLRMAARKTVRDFSGTPIPSFGKGSTQVLPPKSPLLPEFDSIVDVDGDFAVEPQARKALSLGKRECLDAVSLIKRWRGRDHRFPSTRYVAVKHIEALLDERTKSDTQTLLDEASKELGDHIDFGDLLFERWDPAKPLQSEVDETKVLSDETTEALKQKRKAIREIAQQAKQIYRPYYAVLHADGDGMGETLASMTSPADHQAFSERLARFSAAVKNQVPDVKGVVVFAGGDDVLALVPLPCAFDVAKKIRELFQNEMADLEQKPTLSMGMAIVHVTENLQGAVAYSVRLEHLAKGLPKKDALAVGIRTRGGATTEIRCKWDAPTAPADPALNVAEIASYVANLLSADEDDRMPRGFPYEVRNAAQELQASGVTLDWTVRGIYERLLAKKQHPKAVPPLPCWVTTPDELADFADCLIIAHFMTRSGDED